MNIDILNAYCGLGLIPRPRLSQGRLNSNRKLCCLRLGLPRSGLAPLRSLKFRPVSVPLVCLGPRMATRKPGKYPLRYNTPPAFGTGDCPRLGTWGLDGGSDANTSPSPGPSTWFPCQTVVDLLGVSVLSPLGSPVLYHGQKKASETEVVHKPRPSASSLLPSVNLPTST